MRKFIKYTALVLGITFSTTACKEFLDVKPTDVLVEDLALQDYNDFSLALNGAYSAFTATTYYTGNFFALSDVSTDNLKKGPLFTNTYGSIQDIIFTTDGGEFSGFFQQAYLAIYRVNVILSKIDGIATNLISDAQKSQIRSECLALRALAHHDLVRVFAQRYDATPDASHLGIPIKTTPSITPPSRNTVKEVYVQILADLNTAIATLPTTTRSPYETNTLFTVRGAQALRARVAMYMRDWVNAEVYATQVVGTLSSSPTYENMFGNGTGADATGEVLFKFKIPRVSGAPAVGVNYYNRSAETDGYTPTDDLLALYDAGDIRFNAFFKTHPAHTPATPRYVVKKYEGTGSNPGVADIKILRMSEMYLIRAEARARKAGADEVGALSDLDQVRSARLATLGTETGTALIASIMKERRRELFLEGHRLFDLSREQQPMNRGLDCNAIVCALPANSFRFVYPIPQAELFANPNMVQNPGY